MLVQHPETDIGSSSPHWGVKEQTVSSPVPLMTRTPLSQNPRILASEANPTLYVQADGSNNMSSVLIDWEPWSCLGPDSRDPVHEILVE